MLRSVLNRSYHYSNGGPRHKYGITRKFNSQKMLSSLVKDHHGQPKDLRSMMDIGSRYLRSSSRAMSTTTMPLSSSSSFVGGMMGMLGGLFLIGGGISGKYMYDEVEGSEGLVRTASFYSLAIPKYVEYRWHMYWNNDDDELWEELDRRTSKQGLDKILELGGFYIKSGQLCANNIGNAFPKVWQDTMSVLQNDCPCQPYSIVKSILDQEFASIHRKVEDVFSYIDPKPLGAASIGQVHKAILRDSGEEVVIKVMYPYVERIFRGDVRTIKMFCKVAQPVHVPPLEEIERQFMTEFDYLQEAQQMDTIRNNLLHNSNFFSSANVKVPKPYLEFCTSRVLVMEQLHGEKLSTALQQDFDKYYNKRNMDEKTKSLISTLLVNNKDKNKSNLGPTRQQYDWFIQYVNQKRKMSNLSAMLYNYTVAWWKPNSNYKSITPPTIDSLPINHAKLIDDLILIHGHEVLVDGYFNGDPHPGNILHLSDGKLGLIDYGQVKELSKEKRLLLCQLIIALAEDDKNEIVSLMKKAGYKSQNMDPDVIYTYAKVAYDEDNEELTGGKHIQLFLEDLQNKDPIDSIPTDYIIVGRTSSMLRGLAHSLRQSRSVAQLWKPIAESVLQKEGLL